MQKVDKLWTRSFISACVGNFMLFFAFYLLVPIFPLYLINRFQTSITLIGVILSSYTIAALLIRPFAGFVLDLINRKPLYLIAYLLFVFTFVGYPIANSIGLFLFFRILHGFSYGFVTTAGNSFIVDIMPSSRRGEGLGYFGVANNMAMAIGPMTSLFMLNYFSYDFIFYSAIISGFIGFIFSLAIKPKNITDRRIKQPLAFDRFFLFKGIHSGLSLLLMGIPYGMVVTYITIFGKELGIKSGVGIFFTLMAFGLIWSRIIAGKKVDNGKLTHMIAIGTLICLVALFALSTLKQIDIYNHSFVLSVFYSIALLLGIGYGMMFPAYNTLFVNLAPHNRRATASSTYMTSWDIGVGIGLIIGGRLADSKGGMPLAFLISAFAAVFSFIFFIRVAGPFFIKNKLR